MVVPASDESKNGKGGRTEKKRRKTGDRKERKEEQKVDRARERARKFKHENWRSSGDKAPQRESSAARANTKYALRISRFDKDDRSPLAFHFPHREPPRAGRAALRQYDSHDGLLNKRESDNKYVEEDQGDA